MLYAFWFPTPQCFLSLRGRRYLVFCQLIKALVLYQVPVG